MNHGDRRTLRLYEKLEAQGQDTPLSSAPEPAEDEVEFWRAFVELHQSRARGTPVSCPITFSDVLAWCTVNGVYDQEDLAEFARTVKKLDDHWLGWAHDQVEQRARKG